MPAFPLYIDLTDKKVLVFGGGEVALRKIRTLLAFHPLIEVYAENICSDLQKLIDEKKIFKAEAAVRFDEEKLPSVLDAFMVICATDNEVFNHKMAKKCRELDVWFNSATSASDCSFIFPSVTVRGDIVCGVTSSGNTPALTKKIREIVDSSVPEWYGELSRRLIFARLMVKEKIFSQKKRQQVLRTLTDYGLLHEGRIPDAVIWTEIQKANEGL